MLKLTELKFYNSKKFCYFKQHKKFKTEKWKSFRTKKKENRQHWADPGSANLAPAQSTPFPLSLTD
jgi:hypothetical protein